MAAQEPSSWETISGIQAQGPSKQGFRKGEVISHLHKCRGERKGGKTRSFHYIPFPGDGFSLSSPGRPPTGWDSGL